MVDLSGMTNDELDALIRAAKLMKDNQSSKVKASVSRRKDIRKEIYEDDLHVGGIYTVDEVGHAINILCDTATRNLYEEKGILKAARDIPPEILQIYKKLHDTIADAWLETHKTLRENNKFPPIEVYDDLTKTERLIIQKRKRGKSVVDIAYDMGLPQNEVAKAILKHGNILRNGKELEK